MHHYPSRYHHGVSSRNGKKQLPICLPIKSSLSLKLDSIENLLNWTWTKRRRKKNNMWVINQHFVQPNLVLKDIHQDQHTCPGQFREPREWPRGLDLPVVCSPLICKLVSMKVTVCGNGNHMGWWLLSVKIASMACVARHNIRLRAGRRKLCEERKKVVSENLRQEPAWLGRKCQAGTGTWNLGTHWRRDACVKHQPSLPSLVLHTHALVERRQGTEPRLRTHTDLCRMCTGHRILSYLNIPRDAGGWRNYARR